MRQEETKKVERMASPPSSGGVREGGEDGELAVSIATQETPPADEINQRKEEGDGGGGGEGETQETEKVASKKAEGSEDKKKRTKAFNYTSDVYNGADMDSYQWSQTVTEVEIKVGLEEGTTAKHVKVDIQNERIRVEILHPEHKVVLDGKLTNRVKVDESMWNVDRETSTLCINLEKSKELMWKSVLEGEKEIDITKVETYTCRRSRVRLHTSFINEKCFQSCPHRAARATQCRIES
ncbi:Nuclear movement protein nudc [Geodia barretti]|uniref:Nuclear movement protein nudc n=1 Tax=Geodia barretti TaxID=519541 RepID=A0AA35RT95_GEOBA|nr:Nuclear movement protein nudc [Geodia barretti]